uniref:Uncharacterized protein n=1 Tax=Faxonius propinquus nudivirus TaxID=3139431 RepID=A0AAU8GD50_9VIRU
MPIFVAIMYNDSIYDSLLFEKSMLYDNIDYIHIYPNRIHFNRKLYYINNFELKIIDANNKDAIIVKIFSYDDDLNLKKLFSILQNDINNILHLFVIFSTDISIIQVLRIVENISKVLDQSLKHFINNKIH